MKIIILALMLIPIITRAQSSIPAIDSVEFRQDSLAYDVSTNKLANGKYQGIVTRSSKIAYYPNNPNRISCFIMDFQSRIGGMYIEASFVNGLASGIWIIKTMDQKINCGYISTENGYLHGQCVLQCPNSKRKMEVNYYKGKITGIYYIINSIGDTTDLGNVINGELIMKKKWYRGEFFPNYGWCND